jgi:peptidoglycan/LPS O-acetylase OafA/YrhL
LTAAVFAIAGLLLNVGAASRPWLVSVVGIGLAICLPTAVRLSKPKCTGGIVEWLSSRSYAIYIVHLSLLKFALMSQSLPRWASLPIMIGGSFFLAEVSYRYFEGPIMRLRPSQSASANPYRSVDPG